MEYAHVATAKLASLASIILSSRWRAYLVSTNSPRRRQRTVVGVTDGDTSPLAIEHVEPESRATIGGYGITVWPAGGKEPDGTPRHFGRWTFENGLVRAHVESVIHGRVLNACAGKTKLRHGFDEMHRNDLNPERDADTHHDVESIDEHFAPGSFDAVVFDPPWSQEQADEHYEGMHARQAGPARRKLANLLRSGGTFVELGFNMFGPSDLKAFKGWTRAEVNLYRRGQRPPAFMTVDRYPQATLGGVQ